MRRRFLRAKGPAVLALGLAFGAGQLAAAGASPEQSRLDRLDPGRPAAASEATHTEADLYGQAFAASQTAVSGHHAEQVKHARIAEFWQAVYVANLAQLAEAEAAAATRSGGVSRGGGGRCGGDLDCIAQCESGGNPGATNGQYRGAYQFDQRTWESVGGSGDPAAAPIEEQRARAGELYAQQGSSPWPNCG